MVLFVINVVLYGCVCDFPHGDIYYVLERVLGVRKMWNNSVSKLGVDDNQEYRFEES